MKKRTIIIIIGVVVVIVGLMIYLNQRQKRPFKTFEFPETLVVENYTDADKVDTIAMVILNKIMGYDTMNIKIYQMPGHLEKDNKLEFIAFIQQVPFNDQMYVVFLQSRASIGRIKMAMSHEFVHLYQFETGKLKTIDQYGYVWKGDTVKFSEVEYENRPYEIEAFREGPKIERELNQILYK